ncbi:MAG: hypothetical protein KF803_00250 [Cyclobacteriaceae bacterium]|nr:hypothetical protein [Cyclobacteriaceae bacterium]
MKVSAIDKVLDSVMKLDFYSREVILEVLKNRQIEARREEIQQNAKRAKTEFLKGKIKPSAADSIIERLKTL